MRDLYLIGRSQWTLKCLMEYQQGTGSFDDATSLSVTYTPRQQMISAGTVTLTMTVYQ